MIDIKNVVENLLDETLEKVEFMVTKNKIKAPANEDSSCYEHPELIRKQSSGLERCRICYETGYVIPIIHPCYCKGTMGAVHLICLEHWLEESDSNCCELCGYQFSVIRVPRYNVFKSVWVWLCSNDEEYRSQVRSLRIDIIRCLVITPLTIVCSYMCVIVADSYSLAYRNGYIMMTILIISYLIWIYLTTQYHHRIWFHWWRKNSIVTIRMPEKAQEA